MTNKKIKLRLSSLDHCPDGALINVFIHEARRAGWTEPEIETVKRNALSADRDHLIKVLLSYCISNPYYDTPSVEEQLNEVVDCFVDDDYDEFEVWDEYDDDDGCNWDDVEDNSPCSYCARPDSDCESCPHRG